MALFHKTANNRAAVLKQKNLNGTTITLNVHGRFPIVSSMFAIYKTVPLVTLGVIAFKGVQE